MFTFLKLVAALAKYGKAVVAWAWANKGTILKYIERGFSLGWLIDWVRSHF